MQWNEWLADDDNDDDERLSFFFLLFMLILRGGKEGNKVVSLCTFIRKTCYHFLVSLILVLRGKGWKMKGSHSFYIIFRQLNVLRFVTNVEFLLCGSVRAPYN